MHASFSPMAVVLRHTWTSTTPGNLWSLSFNALSKLLSNWIFHSLFIISGLTLDLFIWDSFIIPLSLLSILFISCFLSQWNADVFSATGNKTLDDCAWSYVHWHSKICLFCRSPCFKFQNRRTNYLHRSHIKFTFVWIMLYFVSLIKAFSWEEGGATTKHAHFSFTLVKLVPLNILQYSHCESVISCCMTSKLSIYTTHPKHYTAFNWHASVHVVCVALKEPPQTCASN